MVFVSLHLQNAQSRLAGGILPLQMCFFEIIIKKVFVQKKHTILKLANKGHTFNFNLRTTKNCHTRNRDIIVFISYQENVQIRVLNQLSVVFSTGNWKCQFPQGHRSNCVVAALVVYISVRPPLTTRLFPSTLRKDESVKCSS